MEWEVYVFNFEGEENTDTTDKLLKKLTNILMQEDLFYKGFITLNVIFAQNDIYLLEINTRLGDSEGQTVLKYLDTNILDIFAAVEHQTLDNLKLKYKDGYAMSVNIINRYYPEVRVFQNAFITKDSVNKLTKDFYFYRRVYEYNTKYIQINDRIMSIIDFNRNIEDLRTNIYKDIEKLEGQNIFYRTDLGKNIT